MRIKTRRDEGPDLPEEERYGQSKSRVQRNFYVKREGLERRTDYQLVVDVRELFITLAQVHRQLNVFRHDFIPGRQRFVGVETHVSLTVFIHPGENRGARWNRCST